MEDRLRECPFCKNKWEIAGLFMILHHKRDCFFGGKDGVRHHCHTDDADFIRKWNTRAADPLMEEMVSYIKRIINLYDFKENDLWMEDGGKLLKKYWEMKDTK